MCMIDNRKISFEEIEVACGYGRQVYRVFFVVDDGESEVAEYFDQLPTEVQKRIISLMARMATYDGYYKSDLINWQLKGYNYGEIRPKPHRIFFFISCGKNLIFFKCVSKPKWHLPDSTYNSINREKEVYERAFREFIKTH